LACVVGFPDFNMIEPFTRATSIHESALGGAYLAGDRSTQADLARMGKELIELVREYKLPPMLTKVIALEEIPQTLVSLSQRHERGKIVAARKYPLIPNFRSTL
jgi:NADPH:quinone reductase